MIKFLRELFCGEIEFEVPCAGDVYLRKDDAQNPFAGDADIYVPVYTIIEFKDGWVKFKRQNGTTDAYKLDSFNYIFTKKPL